MPDVPVDIEAVRERLEPENCLGETIFLGIGECAALLDELEAAREQDVLHWKTRRILVAEVERLRHIVNQDWQCDACEKWFSDATPYAGHECKLCEACATGAQENPNA